VNLSQLQLIAFQVGVPIVELSAEKVLEILDSPQAQLRTARYKKAVFIAGELVFKGPYKAQDKALLKNLTFNYAIELLEEALQLPEWQRGSLRWEFLGYAGNDQYYLVVPNVGRRKDIPYEVVNSKIEMNAKVVRRGEAVRRVSDLEGTERLTADIKLAALQHLYLRFLLDIGDSGTHNALIREDNPASGRLIAGIDLEERRAIKEQQSQLEHLFKKPPSKRQIFLYESEACKIRSFSDRQLDQHAVDGLIAVGIDLERLKENMETWNGSISIRSGSGKPNITVP
jgi:hypothetical protein